MNKKVTYNASGLCYGAFWGGGEGSYKAIDFNGYESIDKLREDINAAVKSGAIDSGMGFQTMIGAGMNIIKVKSVTDDEGEEYFNTDEIDTEFFGDLNDEQQNHLDIHLALV